MLLSRSVLDNANHISNNMRWKNKTLSVEYFPAYEFGKIIRGTNWQKCSVYNRTQHMNIRKVIKFRYKSTNNIYYK